MLREQLSFVEVFPEQELHEIGVVGEKLEVPCDHRTDRLFGRATRRQWRHLGGLHPGIDGSQHLDIQALLITEVVVEHPLVAPSGRDDLVHSDAVIASGCEEFYGRGKQPAPRAYGIPGAGRGPSGAGGGHLQKSLRGQRGWHEKNHSLCYHN